MVKKIQKTAAKTSKKAAAAAPITAASIKDQAQQIWTAGLGALAKAKGERNKAFEALMAEGAKLQKKTQAAAEETISAVTSKASQQFDKLETIFEDRVAKALSRLGVPSAKDVAALSKRVDALAAAVKGGTAAAKPAAAKKPVAKAPVAKKAAAKPAAKPAAKAPAKKAVAAAAKPVAAKKPVAKKAAAPAKKAAAAPAVVAAAQA